MPLERLAQRGLQAVRWPKPVEGEHSMASLGKPGFCLVMVRDEYSWLV